MMPDRIRVFASFFRRRDAAGAQSGSAAIEFAFIAPTFFVILFMIIEGGIMFFGQTVLQNAVLESARLIRTGQVQLGTQNDKADFRMQICNRISALLTCGPSDNYLQIDVEAYSAGFSASSPSNPIKSDGTIDPNLSNYSTGNPCDVVVVRAFYKYPVFTPLLTPFLVSAKVTNANAPDHNASYHLLTAAAAVRNEPYTNQVAGC